MRKLPVSLIILLLAVLLTTLLGGCGSHGGAKTQPKAQLSGDTTLFPNDDLLASPSPTYVIPEQTIVLDARRSVAEYDAGHIPGAIFAPSTNFATEENDEVLLPISELEKKLGSMGVTRTSKILIYDNTTASLGAAGRLFWILEYLGCTDVTVLNGGWDQWVAQDLLVETKDVVHSPISAVEFIAAVNSSVEYVTKEYVKENFITNPAADFLLIDVRTDEEYAGSLLNGASRAGHIPGALNFPYAKCFNEEDKTILNYEDFKRLLVEHGITLDKKLVAYSTVGHRSGFFYFLCRMMGYENVSNYTGSIVDWANAAEDQYPMVIGTSRF